MKKKEKNKKKNRRKDNNTYTKENEFYYPHENISTLVSVILLVIVLCLFIPIMEMGEKVSMNDLGHYIEINKQHYYCTEYTPTERIIYLLKTCVWFTLFFGAAYLPDFFINKKKEKKHKEEKTMEPILKFRLFYVAFVILPIFQIMDFRENIKESGFFTCLSQEFTLIVLLGLIMYLIERILIDLFLSENSIALERKN
ncbi:hypothetical protein HLB76_004340 [Salmonella enterica]|nr:hypothetical protein [Salmonella enterica]ECG9774576.1 hypothetical protein [Salmonella enterica]EFO8045399.1 hypothetical protein [Salmonella enterica]EFO8971343.1 hypothetical protein [Salmonella enterica]EGG3375856.1 hypothetical protein [Salmonella enterica]